MLFNSIDFIVFLLIVFALFWVIPTKLGMVKNLLLLVSSYIFYGWWDWRFLTLILASTIVDYFIGKKLVEEKDEKIRRRLLFTSVFFNLGSLAFFKYCNFLSLIHI